MMMLQLLIMLVVATMDMTAADHMGLAPVITPSTSNGTCPSMEQRQSAINIMRNLVQLSLFNRSSISECGDGLWYRVAYLNMTDPSQQCPSVWREYSNNGVRACGRPQSSVRSQPAVFYPTNIQYSKVCGRAIGYQVATPDAFISGGRTINEVYMDGLSITHGTPRQHIWSFVAGVTDKAGVTGPYMCPCVNINHFQNVEPQAFVGDDYYCESGKAVDDFTPGVLITVDPIWDGQNCEREGECCGSGKTPPWFSIQLPSPSTDDIEVRILGDESTDNEDTPVQLLEIFVQ